MYHGDSRMGLMELTQNLKKEILMISDQISRMDYRISQLNEVTKK
jgi:hypothetical protein